MEQKTFFDNLIPTRPAVRKWNGELPKVSGSSGAMIDFSDISDSSNTKK